MPAAPSSHPFLRSSLDIFLHCVDKGDIEGASFCLEASGSFRNSESIGEVEAVERLFQRYRKLQKEQEELISINRTLIAHAQELTTSCWQTMLELHTVKKNYAIAMQHLDCNKMPEHSQDNSSLKKKCEKIHSTNKDKK